jgi:hypothetical protein
MNFFLQLSKPVFDLILFNRFRPTKFSNFVGNFRKLNFVGVMMRLYRALMFSIIRRRYYRGGYIFLNTAARFVFRFVFSFFKKFLSIYFLKILVRRKFKLRKKRFLVFLMFRFSSLPLRKFNKFNFRGY